MAKKKNKKRGFPVFYTIYWTLVILAIAGIGYGCWYLWGLCEDYEAVQPKYAAAPYEAIYTEGRVEEMISLSGGGIELCAYETEQDYVDYVKGLLEGKEITCTSVYSSDDNIKTYVAKADGAKFSNFTLKKSAEKTEYGFDIWEFGGMTMDIPAPETSYTVKVFSNYDVVVNGTVLPESYITQSDIPTFAEGKLPANIYTPRYNVYTFPSHFGAPEISVINEEGEQGVLIADKDSENGWHMDFTSNEEAKAALEEYILKAAKAYCTFISEDTTRAGILKYVVKSSNAADYINAYDNDWFTPHKNYSFSHEATYNYFFFADNCFSVDVQMAFHMSSSNGKEARYPIAYRFYWGFNKDKEQWLIFDYEIIDYDHDLHAQIDAAQAE